MKKILALTILSLMLIVSICSCSLLDQFLKPEGTPDGGNDAHEHSFGEWETKTPATCTEAGEEVRVCACGAEETNELPATGHNYESVVTAPTCTEGGYTTYTCSCGDSYVADEIEAAGHNYESVVTAPTCTSGGYTTYTCSCGDSYVGDETAATDHIYEFIVTAPTCTEGGYTTYTCSCGDSHVGDETAATGHKYESVVTAPTCTATGYTTYTCSCGDSYVAGETAQLAHNMVETSDDTHHWTVCEYNCGVATEKVAHNAASISATYNKDSAMEYDVLTAADFNVTATCECGKTYTATEGITLENNTLVNGENTVTVKFGDLSTSVTLNAVKFNKVVNGTVVDDTYVYSASGSQDKNYVDQKELSANGGNFRVLLRYNFSDFLASAYYQAHKAEAKVQFTFTMTTGTITTEDAITFKVYPTSADRSAVNFSSLTWKTYDDEPHALGWGNAYGFVEKVANSDKVAIDGSKITITVAYRELEQFIDENGNAIFVFAIWKSSTKVGSMENATVDNRPTVQVVLNDEHIHAFINETVDEKYFISANCTEKAKYYYSCSCGAASDKIFEYGEVIEHSYGDWTETQAPTCTVEGVNTKICAKCGDAQTEAIPTLPHNYNAVVTAPTCTEAGYTTYTCSCGDTYTADQVPATGHTYGEWLFDESYHWQACACGDVANKATHEGGEATETEQAVCDTCKQPYGGLASHVHNYNAEVTEPTCTEAGYTTYTCACGDVYTADEVVAKGHTYGEWETVHPATCEGDEVLVRYCDCGESEIGKGAFAFGHDMQTKFDENNHWTECVHNCGKSTSPVAHFGGEATETEKAVCEGCNQPYGEYKPAEKKEYSLAGSVIEDTYIYSGGKNGDNSGANFFYLYSSDSRAYVFADIYIILDSEDFETFKSEGVFYFTFTIAGNENDVANTKFLLQVANPTYTATDGSTQYTASILASKINWNSAHVNTGAYYNALCTTNIPYLIGSSSGGKTLAQTDKVIYTEGVDGAAGTITYKLTYDEIKDYICMDTTSEYYGQIVFKLRVNGSTKDRKTTLYFASSETATPPTVKFVYEK